MTSIQSSFNELGVNAIVATNLMKALNINIFDLEDPSRFSKLKLVTKYISQFPEERQRYIITKMTRGKAIDKLDFMEEYVFLLNKQENIKKRIVESDNVKKEDKESLIEITKEINLYEK